MKYKLTDETKELGWRILHRIEALKDFGNVKAGDKGGWIEKEDNISQDGNCWVYDDACVCGDARVFGNARVFGDACVYGNACVYDDVWVFGDADIKSKDDIIWLTGLGSENRTTTIFRTKEGGVRVACGCFSGDLAEFESRVKETHGENKFAREYLALIGLAKIHFEADKEGV